MQTKIFLNLTNGIEALEKFNLNIDDVNFIRIQSTHIENAAFDKLLLTLDSNFLMSLALGYDCLIYDFGANNSTSKAVYYGLEWIKYVLNIRWFDRLETPYIKEKNVAKQFAEHYKKLDKKTKKQLDYYRKFLLTDKLKLRAITEATKNDNQPNYFLDIIQIQQK
jgi:hypothetical protein